MDNLSHDSVNIKIFSLVFHVVYVVSYLALQKKKFPQQCVDYLYTRIKHLKKAFHCLNFFFLLYVCPRCYSIVLFNYTLPNFLFKTIIIVSTAKHVLFATTAKGVRYCRVSSFWNLLTSKTCTIFISRIIVCPNQTVWCCKHWN